MLDMSHIPDTSFWTFSGEAVAISAQSRYTTATKPPGVGDNRTSTMVSANNVCREISAVFRHVAFQNGFTGPITSGPIIAIGTTATSLRAYADLVFERAFPSLVSTVKLRFFNVGALAFSTTIANYGTVDPVPNSVVEGRVRMVVTLGANDTVACYWGSTLVGTFTHTGSIGLRPVEANASWRCLGSANMTQIVDVGEIYAVASSGFPYSCAG